MPSWVNKQFVVFCTSALLIMVLFLMLQPAQAVAYTIEEDSNDQLSGDTLITPTKSELAMNPGETATAQLEIVNRTSETATYDFTTEDFTGSTDPSQATVFLGGGASAQGAKTWMRPELDSIVLQPGEALTFDVEISVPVDASPGGHYGVVFASQTNEVNTEQTGIKFISRVGTLFLITVPGEIVRSASLLPLEVPGLTEYGPIDIGLVLNNEGNVHLKPSGQVKIRNLLGQEVAVIDVNEWIVLPEAARRTMIEWNGHHLFGRYSVTVEVTYGGDDSPLFAEASFWVIPWKLVLLVAAAAAAATAIIFVVRRRRGY